MRKPIYDLTGKRFGRLVALEFVHRENESFGVWRCKCDCGVETFVRSVELRQGLSQSCGCYQRDLLKQRLTTHGGTNERLYVVWTDMIRRCESTSSDSYYRYGGRGIAVCDEWHDYSKFREWMIANGYDDTAKKGECTLDRIDVRGNYCPENCRIVSMLVQNNNKINSKYITYHGEKKTLAEWAREVHMSPGTLAHRLNSPYWSIEDALTIRPSHKNQLRFGKSKNEEVVPIR